MIKPDTILLLQELILNSRKNSLFTADPKEEVRNN